MKDGMRVADLEMEGLHGKGCGQPLGAEASPQSIAIRFPPETADRDSVQPIP